MSQLYSAVEKIVKFGIEVDDEARITSQRLTPNGAVRFELVKNGHSLCIPADEFHRIFRVVAVSEKEKPSVKVILAEAHRIQAGDRLLITIDPAFAEWGQDVSQELFDMGVDNRVFPLPRGALQFFAVEETINVGISADLQAMQLAPGKDKNV